MARTPIVPLRLAPDAIAELDQIAAYLVEQNGIPTSRADAVRYSVRQTLRLIGKTTKTDVPKKTSRKSSKPA